MGDPKKPRKKYSTPSHPWQKVRIEEERKILHEYGLKNKKEVWKMNSLAKNYRNQIKSLVAARSEQSRIEKERLLQKLKDFGLVGEEPKMDDVLGLTIKDILERRLQTLVFRKGLARSMDQARQFIVHGHIKVGDKKLTRPSYLIRVSEEEHISFISKSALSSADHPERASAS